jgi:hypothetical protein
MEAYLFLVGAPFTGFAGATLANWRFELLRDDNLPITSAFIVRSAGSLCCLCSVKGGPLLACWVAAH